MRRVQPATPRDEVPGPPRLLGDHGRRLMANESISEFSRAGLAASAEDAVQTYPDPVVIKGVSKVFGIAELHLGCLLSGDRAFIDQMRALLPIWNVNALAEAFLHLVGRYRSEIARRLHVEHNMLIKGCAFRTMPGARRYLRLPARTPAKKISR